jgi:hypothetical protein
MKFLALLNLVAVASAIDLYAHGATNCQGGAGVCSNINPGVCCVGSGGSVAARGIPLGWRIQLRAYTGGGCTNLDRRVDSGGAVNWLCIQGGFFTGQSYIFNGRKRDEDVQYDESECQKPDKLALPDGSLYDLTGLTDEEFDVM